MSTLLHISSSPRGTASESLAVAEVFLDAYREAHPNDTVEVWDLWDGSLPAFGRAAAGAKMTVFAGAVPEGEQGRAWDEVQGAFARFAAADAYLFSVPMWNSGVPYILKQFIDVVSQPGAVFGFDPAAGYTGLVTGRKAAVVYTSAVYGPDYREGFGCDYQQTFFDGWLDWAGITDHTAITFRPNLVTADADIARRQAHAAARDLGKRF
jgi:FMN-dependent NADH-azoreductase